MIYGYLVHYSCNIFADMKFFNIKTYRRGCSLSIKSGQKDNSREVLAGSEGTMDLLFRIQVIHIFHVSIYIIKKITAPEINRLHP